MFLQFGAGAWTISRRARPSAKETEETPQTSEYTSTTPPTHVRRFRVGGVTKIPAPWPIAVERAGSDLLPSSFGNQGYNMRWALRVWRSHPHANIRPTSRSNQSERVRVYSQMYPRDGPQSAASCFTEHAEVLERLNALLVPAIQLYPRLGSNSGVLSCSAFNKKYALLKNDEVRQGEEVVVRGRVHSLRIAGSKLVFLDLVQEGHRVQGLCNLSKLSALGLSSTEFRAFYHRLRRGDIFALRGIPHRTSRGELSVQVTALPELLSPCLHPLPTQLRDKGIRIRNRHADFLVNQRSSDLIRLRSEIIRYLRRYLLDDGQTEVQTPILAAGAGGAIARPFKTSATEFPERQLVLRIAPELWLKRMVVGGYDRVFEIGPSFRNEGLDPTHNPEFMTCEFYRAYTNIDELISMSETLFSGLARHTTSLTREKFTSINEPRIDFSPPFRQIDFIPAIEAAIGRPLPDLASITARSELIKVFDDLAIPVPASATLPRLLDKLSSLYIEPQCKPPTFVINHPECLSPLSKSFAHSESQQRISARAELFVNGQEIVNMYEEENSPFEQRRKFVEQLKYRDDENESNIDEDYLDALQWGLPPTGGWGCGIDRLCMLMSGASKIGDVLSFGTLRNVAASGRAAK